MTSDKIIYYDEAFIRKFEELKDLIEMTLEDGDKPRLHRFLIDNFGYIFRLFQYYGKEIAVEGAKDLEEADEETKRELMRPLSFRQYRMIERAFSIWKDEEGLVIWSIWDYLHDNGRIYEKKVMSIAEVSGCSLILEEVYRCLG